MPTLSSHQSNTTVKLLLIGDSSAGKTGALASLAMAGLKLRILDFDNGLDILKNYLTDPASPYYKANPQAANEVRFVTLVDPTKNLNGQLVHAKAEAWPKAMNLLAKWKDQDEDLGPLTSWGEDCVLVIDSLTMLTKAALNYHLFLNSALQVKRTQNEGRRDVGAAQNMIRDLLSMLYDPGVKCNVVVTSHITMVSDAGGAPKVEEGKFDSIPTGYPSAIGRALSPHIPRWFNSMLVIRTVGAGPGAKHKIFTSSQNLGSQIVAAKTSAPLRVKPEYGIENGLAEYFRDVKGI